MELSTDCLDLTLKVSLWGQPLCGVILQSGFCHGCVDFTGQGAQSIDEGTKTSGSRSWTGLPSKRMNCSHAMRRAKRFWSTIGLSACSLNKLFLAVCASMHKRRNHSANPVAMAGPLIFSCLAFEPHQLAEGTATHLCSNALEC